MEINLEPKQTLAFTTPATEFLAGGAAGGGKSFMLRVSALRWCMEVPGIQVYLFRRTLPDLRDNHLRGPTSFQVLLAEHLASGHVKYRSVENEFEFWNGSILHLCYCDSENDVEKYRGAEIHVLLMDELVHFSDYQYRFLRSRVRIAGLKIPEQYKARLPRIECASNPGSVGHAWVKRTWISPKPPMEIWKAPASEGGMLRQFIPARLSDNPHLTREDPMYADRLRGLGTDSLVRAMLEGDWDIVAGQAFEKLRRDLHGVEPFEPPQDWLCFGSFDWGSTRPFSFGLWCVANGNALPDGRLFRRGAIIRYDEWYGWTGKPNEGLRMEVREVAEGIRKLYDRKLGYIVSDPSIWKVDGGPSIAETMMKHGVIMRRGDNSRHTGYVEVRNRIKGDAEGPMLFATTNCHAGFWRTMPDIVMDEHRFGLKSEDVDCWVAGTPISTPAGQRPIETICVGDMVDTPIGPRKVLKAYVSGSSETVQVILENGTVLNGTPHHKVYVDGVGLVPLSQLRCYDSLITRREPWQEQLFYFTVLFSRATRTVTTLPLCRRIVSFGCSLMEKFQRGITSIIETTIGQTTSFQILSAYHPQTTLVTTTTSAPAYAPANSGGVNPMREGKHYQRTCANFGLTRLRGHLRADIVEILLKQNIHNNGSVPKNVRKSGIGRSSLVKSVEQIFGISGTRQDNAGRVRIVAVGRSEGKRPVYNLTVDEAHLFYAKGILSSNTDQEDHCYDDVRMACMSRPWTQETEKAKPARDRWMRFEPKEEESYRTV